MSGIGSHRVPAGRPVGGRSALSVSVTEAGRQLAASLPFPHVHGSMGDTVRRRWSDPTVGGFVLFAAVGAATRVIGPLLADKHQDPAVVCVDDAGRYVVALAGGHEGGANRLAETVAHHLGAEPVITTASDTTGRVGIDTLPGMVAEGDVAGVTAALLDGRPVSVERPEGWPVPSGWPIGSDDGSRAAGGRAAVRQRDDDKQPGARLVITDRTFADVPRRTALLRPPSLVLGVGTSSDADPEEVRSLVERTFETDGLSLRSVSCVATIDRRANHPAVTGLGWPIRSYTAEQLCTVPVPHPSDVVGRAVGTTSVSEAAALLAAGSDGVLVVPKHSASGASVAVARRRRPRGSLSLVGLGPGDRRHRTPAADLAVRQADVVIGYGPYVDQCADLLTNRHRVVRSPLGSELDRARLALELAGDGQAVAVVCSGDAGIYAMASPVLELVAELDGKADGVGWTDLPDIEVVPGVTAGIAAAAVLGAPLGHDHALISLSDLLTPWSTIEARLQAAADSDLVVVLYNPRSERRAWQMDKALAIVGPARPPSTPVGVVTDAGRHGEHAVLTTVAGFDPGLVTMATCVIIGSSTTRVVAGRMVTPRGYSS